MTWAIITAAGGGKRLGCGVPKSFIKIKDVPIYIYTLRTFIWNLKIDKILLMVSEGVDVSNDLEFYFGKRSSKITVLIGGNTADETRFKALEFINNLKEHPDYVIFHDAVRPGLPSEILDGILECEDDALTTYINHKDCQLDMITNKPIWNNTVRLQTPQMFKFDKIYYAYKHSKWNGCPVFVYLNCFDNIVYYPGDERNFKITTKDDLKLCQNLL